MKKFIAILLTFFFIGTTNCYALSELYYLKGIKTTDMEPIVENGYISHNFNLVKKNPYWGVSSNNESVVIIMQQSGDNMFYYYQSDENSKVNKSILRDVKKRGITVEQSFNTTLIDIYDGLAKEVGTDTVTLKTYNFDEPEENVFQPPQQQYQQSSQQLSQSSQQIQQYQKPQQQYSQPVNYQGYVTQLGAGTKIQAYLQTAINTATASKGDQIIAVLTNSLTYNGQEVAPQGSLVYGSLSKARPAAYGSRNGRVVINFNQLVTPDNKVYNISTEEIDFSVSNEGKIGESVKSAAGAALAGALVGLLFGALSGSDHMWRNAAIGAGVGAGSSAVYSTAERGVDAEIPSFTEIEITLTQPLSVTVGF